MIRTLALFLIAALALSGCGILYTDVKLPRAYRTAVPSEVKASTDDPTVSGKACNHSVLYLVAWGDGGYAAAARNALKDHPDRVLYDVKSDLQAFGVLVGLYSRNCTIVTGKAAKP
jgi:hypothetical protein